MRAAADRLESLALGVLASTVLAVFGQRVGLEFHLAVTPWVDLAGRILGKISA